MFQINFRREEFKRARARARRRLILVGAWTTYVSVVVLLVGLYALNHSWIAGREARLARQIEQARLQPVRRGWELSAATIARISDYRENAPRWRNRLTRLGDLLPPNAVLTSMSVNPENLPGIAERNLLVISGEVRGGAGSDGVQRVVELVSALGADSLFSRGYASVRLASSQTLGPPSHATQFVIECR